VVRLTIELQSSAVGADSLMHNPQAHTIAVHAVRLGDMPL
jgi:hypothetical protein